MNKVATQRPATVDQLLSSAKQQIQIALPKAMSSERFIRVAMTEIRKSQALQACHPISICAAVMQAAQLGLEFGATLGHAYLVPYKGEATLLIGYKGLIKLAKSSGEIKKIEARGVYEGDQFDYQMGTDSRIEHRPCGVEKNLQFVYAVATLSDGTTQFDVMPMHKVEETRDNYSKARDKEAWTKSFDEMAKKTVVRRLLKMLPLTTELADALDREDSLDREEKKSDSQKLARVVESQMQLTGPEEAQAFDQYARALTEAEALGMEVSAWPSGESVTAHDALGYAGELRGEIDAWKQKKESKIS